MMNAPDSENSRDLDHLEQVLASVLVPIAPRPEFVHDLHLQLRSASQSSGQTGRLSLRGNERHYTLLGLAGLFSTLMLLVAGFRTAAAILGIIGLFSEFNKQVKPDDSAPSAPAV